MQAEEAAEAEAGDEFPDTEYVGSFKREIRLWFGPSKFYSLTDYNITKETG